MEPSHNGARPIRAIDRARSAWTATRDMVEVPEWADDSGTPLEVFFTRLTAADHEAVRAREPKTDADTNVLLLIHKARDEQGKNLFEFGDRHMLLAEVEYAIILRVIGAMLRGRQIASVDEAKTILGDDKALAFRMALAEHLHKSLDEVEAMPVNELTLWAGFFAIKAEEQDKKE